MISKLIELAEKGIIPDYFIRQGIVRNCENRLNNENVSNTEKVSSKKRILKRLLNKVYAASNAFLRSSMISSICSIPIDNLT